MNKALFKLSVSLLMVTASLLINEKSYADNTDFLLKVSKAKKDKLNSGRNTTVLSFADAVKMQKKKVKPVQNVSYSFSQAVRTSKAKGIITESNKSDFVPYYKYVSASIDDKAIKKFITKNNPYITGKDADNIISTVTEYSNEKNIDPKLIIALMAIESNFNVNAVSSVGAMGLGQLMPGTAQDMGIDNAFNFKENIRGTIRYLSDLLKHYNGDLELSLASYNWGPNAVQAAVKNGESFPSSVQKYVANIKYIHNKLSSM